MPTTRRNRILDNFLRLNPSKKSFYRRIERCYRNIERTKLQLRFLKNCLKDKVIPKTLLPFRFRNKFAPFSKIEEGACIKKQNR